VTLAYLGLGSNLGDRESNLQAAREALDWGPARLLRCSRIYETEPVGGPNGQPWFLNQVCEVDTRMTPEELLERCLAIETALGRRRDREERWGPRVIDVDLLLFGDQVRDTPTLTLPHPRLAVRAFVLIPLVELDPELSVPGQGRVDGLLKRCGDPHRVSVVE
jgi:2-amino-4-hydroxy-6-hydroxymethyldihydropteridine diphosphokinase